MDHLTAETSGDSGSDEGSGGGKKIGITVQNIENAYWAGVMSKLGEILKETDMKLLSLDVKKTHQHRSARSKTLSPADVT